MSNSDRLRVVNILHFCSFCSNEVNLKAPRERRDSEEVDATWVGAYGWDPSEWLVGIR